MMFRSQVSNFTQCCRLLFHVERHISTHRYLLHSVKGALTLSVLRLKCFKEKFSSTCWMPLQSKAKVKLWVCHLWQITIFFLLPYFTIQILSITSLLLKKKKNLNFSSSWEILRFAHTPAAKREQPKLAFRKSNMKFVVNVNSWVWESKGLWRMSEKRGKPWSLTMDRNDKAQSSGGQSCSVGRAQANTVWEMSYLNKVKC